METNTIPPAPSRSARRPRRHGSRRPWLITLLAALLLTACGGTAGPGSGAAAPDGDWVLRSGTTGDMEVPIIDGHDITLTVDGDDWGGTAACNTYGGTVRVDGAQVTATEVFQTEMGCVEDGVMDSEAQYLEAFRQISSIEVDSDQLILRDDPSGTELIYDRVSPDEDTDANG
jgi:heat shock protein HslJ